MSKQYSSSNFTTNNTRNTESPFNFNTTGWILSLLLVLPGNCYVIWLIVTGAANGVASEFFSLNLCVCEMCLCLQSLLSLLSSTFPGVYIYVQFLAGVSMTGRPLFQCLICVDCYMAVIHPFAFLKFKALRYKAICSAAGWLVIVSDCVFACGNIIPNQLYFFMSISLCLCLIALSLKLFCCLAVLRALKQSGPGAKGRAKTKENLIKRRAFQIIVLILMATVVTYAAYLVAALIYLLTGQFISMLWTAGHVCVVLGGLVQPLLYLYRTGKQCFCKSP